MAVDLPRRLPAMIATAVRHGWRTEILTSQAMDDSYRTVTVTWHRGATWIDLAWTRQVGWRLALAELHELQGTRSVRIRVRDVPGLLTAVVSCD